MILSQVLAHNCNIGYENNRNMVIRSFNGEVVKSLKHLKSMLDIYLEQIQIKTSSNSSSKDSNNNSSSSNLVFECTNGMVLVLDGVASIEAEKQICAQHFMPNSHSPDLED